MQRKDIEIGVEYAYRRYKSARAERVKVIDFDAKVRTASSYGYGYGSGRTVNGITIEFTEGHAPKGVRINVTGRQLSHTWAQEESDRKVRDEREQQRLDATREEAARRADTARRIESVLRFHGENPSGRLIRSEQQRLALTTVGFRVDLTTEETPYFRGKSVIARFDLELWMSRGVLDEKVVNVLLADSTIAMANR